MSTIAAIATALVPEAGSVAIVRLSGPEAREIGQHVFRGHHRWQPRRIYYGHVVDGPRVVDEVLLLWMPAPRSFTREDVVELHCHGGIVVVQEVLALCLRAGARLAQPGEFTLRAFLNGRIDLTQAEAVAQLVSSRSPQAAQLALAGLTGKLAQPIRQLNQRLTTVLADIEAHIDFEEDLPPLDMDSLVQELKAVETEINHLIATAEQGELLRTGIKVALVGRPNVGKSSILNSWSQSDRALVTDIPGTTRDLVDIQLIVRGMPVQVLDTAGLRQTTERVEALGIERSRQAMQRADVVLLVLEAPRGWTPEDQAIYEEIQRPVLILVNKMDLAPCPDLPVSAPVITFSALLGQGIPELETALWQLVGQGLTGSNVEVAINQRHKEALLRVQTGLQHLQLTQANALPLDFWSIDLRSAIRALAEITGDEVTESLLSNIFSRFCIGK